MSNSLDAIRSFEQRFYEGRLNRFVGSGGEVLLKAEKDAPSSRMDVGDRLIGIGAAHLIEDLSAPPGPDSFRATTGEADFLVKCAARGFTVTAKNETSSGFDFTFAPFSPKTYADTLETVSGGAVRIAPASIPTGTIILSFIDRTPGYTLRTIEGSPGANWAAVTRGERHWNVGFGKPDDFWQASFPSDDIGALKLIARANTIGAIRFGLSLLDGSTTYTSFETVPCTGPGGEETRHHFCLDGAAAGTLGMDTPFPIGVRTAITFLPSPIDA